MNPDPKDTDEPDLFLEVLHVIRFGMVIPPGVT